MKKNIEEGLDHKNLQVTKVKYFQELIDEPKKQPNRILYVKN